MNLNLMKKQAELLKVQAGKAELEVQIAVRQEEIKRLEENVLNQDKKINELSLEIKTLGE